MLSKDALKYLIVSGKQPKTQKCLKSQLYKTEKNFYISEAVISKCLNCFFFRNETFIKGTFSNITLLHINSVIG